MFWPGAIVTIAFFQFERLADEAADALLLAAHDQRADVDDVDVAQLLDRVADLDLVGVPSDLEEQLRLERLGIDLAAGAAAAGLLEQRPLLGEERALDDLFGCHAWRSFLTPAAFDGDAITRASTCLIASAAITRPAWRRMS